MAFALHFIGRRKRLSLIQADALVEEFVVSADSTSSLEEEWRRELGRVFKFVIVCQRACAPPSGARKRAELRRSWRRRVEILKTRPGDAAEPKEEDRAPSLATSSIHDVTNGTVAPDLSWLLFEDMQK